MSDEQTEPTEATETTETEPEVEGVEVPENQPDLSAKLDESTDLADRIFERQTKTGAAAMGSDPIIPRKRRTFIMDGASCAPFIYWDSATGDYLDFKVTIQSLSHADEIAAMTGVRDAGQVPSLLCMHSLYAINGKPIRKDRKAFYWETFGQQGRQIVLMAFQSIGSASGAALGKFQRSLSID